jgi:hypothetical protein
MKSLDASAPICFAASSKYSLFQGCNDVRGPLRDPFVQQLRRPAAEEK